MHKSILPNGKSPLGSEELQHGKFLANPRTIPLTVLEDNPSPTDTETLLHLLVLSKVECKIPELGRVLGVNYSNPAGCGISSGTFSASVKS